MNIFIMNRYFSKTATQRARILLTDNIQSGGSCGVNITSYYYYCPRRDFAQKAKSRGGTLVTRAYIKEGTHSRNIQSYSQYRKNLDLLEQAPRGIGR